MINNKHPELDTDFLARMQDKLFMLKYSYGLDKVAGLNQAGTWHLRDNSDGQCNKLEADFPCSSFFKSEHKTLSHKEVKDIYLNLAKRLNEIDTLFSKRGLICNDHLYKKSCEIMDVLGDTLMRLSPDSEGVHYTCSEPKGLAGKIESELKGDAIKLASHLFHRFG